MIKTTKSKRNLAALWLVFMLVAANGISFLKAREYSEEEEKQARETKRLSQLMEQVDFTAKLTKDDFKEIVRVAGNIVEAGKKEDTVGTIYQMAKIAKMVANYSMSSSYFMSLGSSGLKMGKSRLIAADEYGFNPLALLSGPVEMLNNGVLKGGEVVFLQAPDYSIYRDIPTSLPLFSFSNGLSVFRPVLSGVQDARSSDGCTLWNTYNQRMDEAISILNEESVLVLPLGMYCPTRRRIPIVNVRILGRFQEKLLISPEKLYYPEDLPAKERSVPFSEAPKADEKEISGEGQGFP
jgi:hypothetical protein